MPSPGTKPSKGTIPEPTRRKDRPLFEGKVVVGYRNGRPLRKSVYGRTKQEYWEKALQLLNQSPLALLANADKVTLKRWLERFIRDKAPEVRQNTLENYQQYFRYIVADLGGILLTEIKSAHIDFLLRSLAERNLSPSVRKHVYHFLKKALRKAYQLDIIPANPADKLDAPKGGTVRNTSAWTPSEVKRVLAAAEGTRWYAPISFAITTGVRPGELFALQYSDIQGSKVKISRTLLTAGPTPVFGKPKTKSSERVFHLDGGTLAVLEQYRYLVEEERALAGSRWRDFALVFPSSLGTPVSINNFRRALRSLAEVAQVPYRTPHELRHTHITLIRRKADVKLVSRKAGHADTVLTDKVYNHPGDDDLKAVAIPLERLLGDEVEYEK